MSRKVDIAGRLVVGVAGALLALLSITLAEVLIPASGEIASPAVRIIALAGSYILPAIMYMIGILTVVFALIVLE